MGETVGVWHVGKRGVSGIAAVLLDFPPEQWNAIVRVSLEQSQCDVAIVFFAVVRYRCMKLNYCLANLKVRFSNTHMTGGVIGEPGLMGFYLFCGVVV